MELNLKQRQVRPRTLRSANSTRRGDTPALAGVRGFARGLRVLRELNVRPCATALQLSQAANLPRSTVYRLLDTLIEEGYVRQIPGDDHYRLKTTVAGLSSGLNSQLLVAELAQPIIEELNRAIGWPVLLHGFEGNVLKTWQVTRSKHVRSNPRVGSSAPILLCSPGRLFYASLSDNRQAEVRSMLVKSRERSAGAARNIETLNWVVEEVRRRGYGFRDEGLVPETCSFAVPIIVEGKPEAYITVVFSRSEQPLDRATQNYLPVTRDAAEAIGKAVLDRTKRLAQPDACFGSRSETSA